MEYGLGQGQQELQEQFLLSLNPSFNGIWSRTAEDYFMADQVSVLS